MIRYPGICWKLTVLLVCYWTASKAQSNPYTLTFGDSLADESIVGLHQLPGGNILLAGYSSQGSFGQYDAALVKTDPNGNIIWEKFYGGPDLDQVAGMCYTQDNHVVLAGSTSDSSATVRDAFLMKVDTSGNLIWHRNIGQTGRIEAFESVIQTQDGGFAASGFATAAQGTGNDFFLVKCNAAGLPQWEKTYGDKRNDYSLALVEEQNEGFVLTGDKQKIDNTYNVYIVRTDTAGQVVWDLDVANSYNGGCKNLIRTQSGDYLIVGESSSPSSSVFDQFIVRVSSSGQLLWNKWLGIDGVGEAAFGLYEPLPEAFLLTGYGYDTAQGSTRMRVTYMDHQGQEIESRYYGSAMLNIGYAIIPSASGGFLSAGRSFTNPDDYLLVYDHIPVVAGLSDQFSEPHFSLYPNPCVSQQKVFLESVDFSWENWEWWDGLGRLRKSGKSSESIYAPEQKGWYVLRLAGAAQTGYFKVLVH